MIRTSFFCRRFAHLQRARRSFSVRKYIAAQDGAVSAEYSFLIVFISLVAALGFVFLGDSISGNFSVLGERIESASTQMPNPLGGGGSSGGGSSGSTDGGNSSGGSTDGGSSTGGNGNGNANGKNK